MEKNKILIVEDEIIVADYIRKILQYKGYSVPSIASSCENALKEIEDKNPDLVLMDIELKGGMDGIETAKIIHSRFNIPVVFLTADSDENFLEQAKITEPFEYIIKPFNERDLHANIEIALYKHKMERELKDRERRLNEAEKLILKQQVEESQERYRDLFENAQDIIYVLDSESNFIKINKIGIELLGCTKEEAIGSNISRWVTPESLRIIDERRKKSLSGEKVTPTDIIEIVGKNNEHRWTEIRTRVIRSEDRGIEIHGIARDITENRLLKQKLNKSNKRQKILCHLIQGTRGGKTRALILKYLIDKSYNANQLATFLNMDYKTIRHHLAVLIKNGIIGKFNDMSSDSYFILNNIDMNFDGLNPPLK